MLRRVFFFHKCKKVITSRLIDSGRAYGLVVNEMCFRQLITNIPICVEGRTSDRYIINFGTFLFSGNRRKGITLVSMVARLTKPKNENN